MVIVMKSSEFLVFCIVVFFACVVSIVVDIQEGVKYAQVLEVVEIENNLVYLVDWDGNEWIWEGAEDWQIGDYAAATMSTNGTEYIYDDIITDLRYTRIAAR